MKKIRLMLASFLMLSMLVIPMSLNLSAVQAADGTGEVILTGGSLSISVPANVTYSGVTIDGLVDKSSTATFNFSVTDATGSGAGWKVKLFSTVMTSATPHTIAAVNHTFKSSGSVVFVSTDTGVAATNSITTPPTGTLPTVVGSAATLFDAAVDTGMGKSTITVNTALNVPLTAYAGTYTATITLSVESGPS